MADVFISYVRDDEAAVERLARDLRRHDLMVWLDRHEIDPGTRWQTAIEGAIARGGFFLACFSESYGQRDHTFMTEELAIAARLLRDGSRDRAWFIPIRLAPCAIPEIGVSPSESIRSFQWVDLFPDWDEGLRSLLRTVRPPTAADSRMEKVLRDLCRHHIENKIARFAASNASLLPLIQGRWRRLLDPETWSPTLELLIAASELKTSDQTVITERYDSPVAGGCSVVLTVSASHDPNVINAALPKLQGEGHPYARFVRRERQRLRQRAGWETRGLAHWIISQDADAVQVDLLYVCSLRIILTLVGMEMSMREKGQEPGPLPQMYPSSLISVSECELLFEGLLREEVSIVHSRGGSR